MSHSHCTLLCTDTGETGLVQSTTDYRRSSKSSSKGQKKQVWAGSIYYSSKAMLATSYCWTDIAEILTIELLNLIYVYNLSLLQQ